MFKVVRTEMPSIYYRLYRLIHLLTALDVSSTSAEAVDDILSLKNPVGMFFPSAFSLNRRSCHDNSSQRHDNGRAPDGVWNTLTSCRLPAPTLSIAMDTKPSPLLSIFQCGVTPPIPHLSGRERAHTYPHTHTFIDTHMPS